MSISAVNGSGSSFGLAEMMQARRQERPDPDEMAASIVEKDDQDGDGLLNLSETPLDQDRFDEIDADGDGFISAEELSADAQARTAETPTGTQGMAMGGASGSAQQSGSSSDESSEEDYDQYDLNEDGVVTLDELMQAFRQGDQSLQALFDGMDGGSPALNQRLASQAYKAGTGS
ncbi:EF hand [Pseudodesulfovibrio hydrargyri]|uniref:EF hand n=1 Tax=Pseudodesulfovibrio hydrargyri TaxID=2125990 RepID=A0A1J5MU45_9BACT|nr:EF-hand domain-containing protein [Pseudodesulfovibrio hydrargyri]OIQ49380.1 EF hand [Pseudodesulfovibrio hydrargyri]